MGLHNTAHYLKTKGRGDDTELVHMTKGEVHALKGLAAAHGGKLTVNPETGLPEAGFLGSILPMVAGVATAVFAPELLPLVAGGIGVADYAMTGSITKGLMAGLSAYGGGELGTSLAGMGAEAGVEGAAATQASALEGTTAGFDTATYPNLNPQQLTGYQEAFANAPSTEVQKGILQSAAQANAAISAPAASSLTAGQTLSNMGSGLTNAMQAPGSFLMNNATNVAMAAAPILGDTLTKRPTLPGASTSAQTNPMGMKTIPTDSSGHPIFNATLPNQPNPPYAAKYPNYVQNPYNPYAPVGTATPTYTVHAAGGGLMQDGPANVDFMGGDMYPQSQIQRSYYATPTQMPTSAQQTAASYEPKTNPLTGQLTANMREGGIASYSGKYGSMVQANQALQDLQSMYGPKDAISTPHADPGIYQDTDPNTRNLDAYSAALYKLNAKSKAAGMKKGSTDALKPTLKLGDIEEDAQGGIVGMAGGGDTSSHIYRPTYTNYAQTPYNQQATLNPAQLQAASAAYMQQGIPTPTRTSMATGQNAGIAGYALDPSTMKSNAQIAADAEAARQAQLAQQNNGFDAYMASLAGAGAGNGKAGGVMPDDLHYAMGGFVPSLGGYAAGGNPRLLKGPGDGMSDSIPANIGGKQPARLADGEFVVPADVVSHLGNGSTDAGAKKLYSMMDNIRKARTGRKKQAPEVKADKYLPK
jgi:hypothetical protein